MVYLSIVSYHHNDETYSLLATDEELAQRLKNFDDHIMEQKSQRRSHESKQEDLEEDLQGARKEHVELMGEQGKLQANLQACFLHSETRSPRYSPFLLQTQVQLLADRDEMVRDIAAKHQMMGYDHSPLDRPQLVDFISRLKDMQRAQNHATDNLVVCTARQSCRYDLH